MAAGRPKTIQSEEQYLKLWEDYKSHVEANPIIKQEAIRGGANSGDIAEIQIKKPLTVSGFCVYAYDNGVSNMHQYLYNDQDLYKEYSRISTRIRDEIRTQQIEGGMAGLYNASLTARLNGLVDKKEVTGEFNVKQITGMEIK